MKLREIPQWVRDFTHDFSPEKIKKGAYSEDGWGIGGMFFGKPPLKALGDPFMKPAIVEQISFQKDLRLDSDQEC